MADPVIKVERDGHLTIITINREELQNTISGPMLDGLTQLLLKGDRDPDVRAIVLTGSGRFFCAGLDLRSGGGGIGQNTGGGNNLDLRSTPPTVLHGLDTPVICALNGSAAGYGMDLALGCDIRIMSDKAKLSAAFTARKGSTEVSSPIAVSLLAWARSPMVSMSKPDLSRRPLERMRSCSSSWFW